MRDVVVDANGAEHVRYDRTYAGLRVIGGDLVVHESPAGDVRTVSWASPDRIVVAGTTPAISGQAAADAAARRSGLESGSAAPERVVYASDHRPVLAWETTVTGTAADGTPVRDLVYTDARTGKQLGTRPWSSTPTAPGLALQRHRGHPDQPVGFVVPALRHHARRSQDLRREQLHEHLDRHADDRRRQRVGQRHTSSRQSAAVDAHYGAAVTWDFFKDAYGRSGIRNDGVAAYSRVHYGNGYENAFWDDSCFCMTYGDGGTTFSPLTSLDVAGHEMSHGVTSHTANLNYSVTPAA